VATARAAVFLDRDGVINENVDGDYVRDWAGFRLLPGSLEAITSLTHAGYPIVVVTNQQGVGKGLVAAAEVEDIHRGMLAAIEEAGGRVDAVLYCPHLEAEGCDCRKPKPGMLRRAASDLGLDLARSVFVGDALSDMEAALSAGCKAVLVLTGRGRTTRTQLLADDRYAAVTVVDDLAAAARLLLTNGVTRSRGGGSGAIGSR